MIQNKLYFLNEASLRYVCINVYISIPTFCLGYHLDLDIRFFLYNSIPCLNLCKHLNTDMYSAWR